MKKSASPLIPLLLLSLAARFTNAKPPHIVFHLVDDLGFSDVSYHGSKQIPTPAIDYLALRGARLNSYYVQPVCSPTRATLMTGRHVIHTGVYDPMNGGSGDLSLNFTLLPQHMRTLGYSTHMVGKWHLGESTRRFTPLDRGYDSYLGYLGGAECYWLHGTEKAIDFFDGYEPCFNYTCWDGNFCDINKYSANVLARRAADVIDEASRGDKPLFLYLAWQNVHSGNHEELQAPQSYIDSFNDTISHQKRRNLAGMIKSLDEGVANVTRALKEADMFEDTLIIFSTDNGGPADNFNGNWASNWPLRGMKRTLFEGGVHAVGFVSGAGLSPARVGSVLTGFVHISDYLPSLLTMAARASDMPEFGPSATWRNVVSATAAAGGNYGLVDPPFVHGDGIDVWDYLSGVNETCPRTWVLHEAHPVNSTDGNGNALRVGDYKIVLRTGASWSRGSIAGTNDGWYGGFGSTDQSNDGYALPTGKHTEPWVVKCPPPPTNVTEGYACEQIKNGAGADDPKYACLFNIAEDPCEHKDLSAEQPEKVTEMMEALATFRATAVNSATATHNPDGANCPAVRVVEGCGPEGSKAPMECHAEAWCHGKP